MRKLPTHAATSADCLLGDYDCDRLATWLSQRTGKASERGRRAAGKALRVAFGSDHRGDAEWSEQALAAANIGRWARSSLLMLDPRPRLVVQERVESEDGTVRLLLRANDGALVESVIIPAEAGRDRARCTLCISSQVGCARACTFCETGVTGLNRQLSAAEIVDQYRIARRMCEPDADDRPVDRRAAGAVAGGEPSMQSGRMPRAAERPISNIVFMGMGEPFDNLREVTRAIALLCDQHAFDFAPSRITVSTVGVADKLEEFFRITRAELAISINAPDDERRSRIMPINQRHSMAALRDTLLAHLPPGRRVLLQYALFAGFNDSLDDADALASYVEPIRCRVNVIPANPGPDPSLVAPPWERVDAFVRRLQQRGVTTLVRRPRGRDVGGACGQLAGSRRMQSGDAPL